MFLQKQTLYKYIQEYDVHAKQLYYVKMITIIDVIPDIVKQLSFVKWI